MRKMEVEEVCVDEGEGLLLVGKKGYLWWAINRGGFCLVGLGYEFSFCFGRSHLAKFGIKIKKKMFHF